MYINYMQINNWSARKRKSKDNMEDYFPMDRIPGRHLHG